MAQKFVEAVVVESGDVLNGGLELGSGAPGPVGDQLGLEGLDEALDHRVVIGIANRADGGQDAMVVEFLV